ncbi:hypothetical protein ACIQZG_03940 [Lysinibacillus sp. NPDC096418]|uniref:hypothetical protein n=1 Tax=Lysinibacillus sp. NPDC096418 TaxID=3364138 RepID=UPI0037F15E75
MSNEFLTREQIEKLLAAKYEVIRATTMEDVQLVRQNIDCLIEIHPNSSFEPTLKENLNLQEYLDETTITVTNETEQQICYRIDFPTIQKENSTYQDSVYVRFDKK